MTVPEPTPFVAVAHLHADADDGLPGPGVGRGLLGGRVVLGIVGDVLRLAPGDLAGGGAGADLGLGLAVERGQLLGRAGALDAAERAAVLVDDDEGGERGHTVLADEVLLAVAVDRADGIAGLDQLGDGRAHGPAGAAPFGVEVEQDGLAAIGRGGRGEVGRRGDQGENQGCAGHAARTPFPGDDPFAPAVAGGEGRARRASSRAGRVAGSGRRATARRPGPAGPGKHAIRIGSEESGCASLRGRASPVHPWAGRASRAPRPPIMEGQVPPASPDRAPRGRHAPRSTDGAVSATSLSPWPPALSLDRHARTEGSASTAVAPYTWSVQGVPDHFLGFSCGPTSAFFPRSGGIIPEQPASFNAGASHTAQTGRSPPSGTPPGAPAATIAASFPQHLELPAHLRFFSTSARQSHHNRPSAPCLRARPTSAAVSNSELFPPCTTSRLHAH